MGHASNRSNIIISHYDLVRLVRESLGRHCKELCRARINRSTYTEIVSRTSDDEDSFTRAINGGNASRTRGGRSVFL